MLKLINEYIRDLMGSIWSPNHANGRQNRQYDQPRWRKPIHNVLKLKCDVVVGVDGDMGLATIIRSSNSELID